jgi:hypothetical protein
VSGRKHRWLNMGLLASGGAGMLALIPTLTAAPALADTGSFEPGGGSAAPTAWVMGPSGFPVPAQSYLDAANSLYLNLPTNSVLPLTTPEGLYPITGVNSLTLDPSVAQGVETLNNVLENAKAPVDVFGYSQSSTIASLEMSQLHNEDPTAPVSFILVGDPSNPDGGFLERFVGGSIPSFGVTASGATPSDLFPTDIITNEYDGFADFPRYPIDILSDLNAYLGIIFEHTAYLNEDPSGALDLGMFGETTYYMNPTDELPLLDLLRFIPGGNPLADLLQPDVSVLVNLGYGSITDGWDTQNAPDVPTPFGLFPTDINPTDLFNALAQGIPEGFSKAVADIQAGQWTDYSSLQTLLDAAHTFGLTPSDTPTLSELLGAAATYFNGDVPINPIDYSSLTDIVNGLTNVVSTDVSTVFPLFDTVLALGVSLPNYDISLFEQGLEAGNLLAAIGDPIAADIGILPLPVGLDLAVLGEALATTGYELIGGLIP